MAKEKNSLGEVKLKNVRLSFAHLFEPQEGKVDDVTGVKGEPKFNCSFLFSKTDADGKANLANVKRAADEVKADKWGKNPPKLKPEKICLRDGDQEDYDGYEDSYYVSSSNAKQPVLIDRKKDSKGKWIRLVNAEGKPIPGAAGLLYSGCYVNAVVRLWAQDNKHGKRINASLEAVQFLKHGDAFGAKQVDAEDAFDDDDTSGFDDDADISSGGDEDEEEDSLI
jgi:hypothetical protein